MYDGEGPGFGLRDWSYGDRTFKDVKGLYFECAGSFKEAVDVSCRFVRMVKSSRIVCA